MREASERRGPVPLVGELLITDADRVNGLLGSVPEGGQRGDEDPRGDPVVAGIDLAANGPATCFSGKVADDDAKDVWRGEAEKHHDGGL